MKPPTRLFPFLAILVAPVALGGTLNVVTSTADLAALASTIGGKHVSVTSLAKPSEDPHFVDAKPSFLVKLNRADLLIEGGAELEQGWLPKLLLGSRNPQLVGTGPHHVLAAAGLPMLEVPTTLDRSQGDIHAAGNPHFLVDPANARIVAGKIARALVEIDPASAADYQANLADFEKRLDARLAEWHQALAPFAGRQIATYHNVWPYFGRQFGLQVDLFLEPKPGIPPTATSLAEVIARMKANHVGLVLVEPFQNRRTAEKVAAETGAKVVDVTQYPGGAPGTEAGYLEMMEVVVQSIARALRESTPSP